MGNEAVGASEERVVAADAKRGVETGERCFPLGAKAPFERPPRVVEQPHVGGSRATADAWREAVDSEMNCNVSAPHLRGDPLLDTKAMRVVVRVEQRLSLSRVESSGKGRIQVGVTDRSVQVDEETAHRAREQRGP